LGYSKDKNYFYLIFELCEEGDLFSFVQKKYVNDEIKLNILIEITEGMSYLHSVKHISHRDLKSANILIEKYRNNVKIADLGQSIALKKDKLLLSAPVGTLTHIAPEVNYLFIK
jgi:serine/threonine protein kinase